MPSEADAKLARRDPEIPALGLVLDGDALTECLVRLYPAAGVTRATPEYVRYKRGTSCLVRCRVECAGGLVVAAAVKAHNPSVGLKIDDADVRRSAVSPLGPIAIDAARGLVVSPFPNDRRLPALRTLATEAGTQAAIATLWPDRPAGPEPVLTPLRYKPERRFVARVELPDSGPAIAVKFYTKGDYRIVYEHVERHESRPPLRLPTMVGHAKELRATAVQWMTGTPLEAGLRDGRLPPPVCRVVGEAVAMFHAQRAKIEVYRTAERFADEIDGAAEAVAQLLPTLAADARRCAAGMSDRIRRRHWRGNRSVHGDLSADQVIVQDDAIAIIDLDRAGRGDPRLDLGAFRARLAFDELLGVLTPDVRAEAASSFVSGYRDACDKDVTRKLDRFEAAHLLLSAVEPFRLRHPQWPTLTAAIIDRVAQTAAAGAGASDD
ncbi:MAG: phosphotransferase [Phycisphaerales bacterium]|nr:phosphotransferase [Phycisphaerae bacterium]NNF41970.1 phosphotransferase [Phycisphaerales bacterium]NNM26783.1 phosphotransferase [Phycisphaerales bacterium]